MLTQERVRDLLHYDPETGQFTRKVYQRGDRSVGDRAGTIRKTGYGRIGVDGRSYGTHRLIWLWVYGVHPNGPIDHINGNPSDNRLVNLRLSDSSLNQANARKRRDSSSSYKGVTWHKKFGRWQASIKKHGRSIYLGLFDDPAEAHSAYCRAAREHFGEFARAA